ncbi:MAG: hypothetical protein J5756_04980 [Clostridia bacterium]|nr:hypothetical protein [Clostridia bacterium]
MDNTNEKIAHVSARFTELATKGNVDAAIEYYESEAVNFNDCFSPVISDEKNLQAPPMNELYKGIKD